MLFWQKQWIYYNKRLHMRPEDGQNIHRLFLYSDAEAGESIAPALRLLRQAVGHSEMVLWLAGDTSVEVWQVPGIQVAAMKAMAHPNLIENLQQGEFDAAILFTAPGRSPFAMGYLCYLAGIPIRIGQSQEFGGGVLTRCVAPPVEKVSPSDYQLHLIRSSGLVLEQKCQEQYSTVGAGFIET
jgi:hypothetical protein